MALIGFCLEVVFVLYQDLPENLLGRAELDFDDGRRKREAAVNQACPTFFNLRATFKIYIYTADRVYIMVFYHGHFDRMDILLYIFLHTILIIKIKNGTIFSNP